MYADYRNQCSYWESIVMARKFVLVVVVVFLATVGVAVQILVALGTIILSAFGQLLMSPFRLPRLEALERFSLYGNTVLLYVAMFFVIDGTSSAAKTALAFLLVIVNVYVVVKIILAFMREHVISFCKLVDTDKDGWITDQDITRASEKAKGMMTKGKVRVLTGFVKWAKAGGTSRQAFAAYLVPYGLAGVSSSTSKSKDHPDRWMELIALVAVDKSLPSLSAKSAAMLSAYNKRKEEERARLRAEYPPPSTGGSVMGMSFIGRIASTMAKSFSRGHKVAPLISSDNSYYPERAAARGPSKISVRFAKGGQVEAERGVRDEVTDEPGAARDEPGAARDEEAARAEIESGWDRLINEPAAAMASNVEPLDAFEKVKREEEEASRQPTPPTSIRVTPSLPLEE